jgi:predicted thioredoxin/glutaredoxin
VWKYKRKDSKEEMNQETAYMKLKNILMAKEGDLGLCVSNKARY